MGAETERQVVVRIAGDIELLGVLEDLLVEVGGLEEQDHLLALLELGAVELGVFGDGARHVLHRSGPAQHLFDRIGQQVQVLDQALVLIGVTHQLSGAARQRVPGGLVAADQQQQHLGDDLVILELLTLHLRVHEHADEIVGRVCLALGDHPRHVLAVRGERLHRDLHIGRIGRAAQGVHQVVGPPKEHLALLWAHPEHVADHRHRKRCGDVPNEVALTTLAHRVDQGVAQRNNRSLEVFHALAGEAGVDEFAT